MFKTVTITRTFFYFSAAGKQVWLTIEDKCSTPATTVAADIARMVKNRYGLLKDVKFDLSCLNMKTADTDSIHKLLPYLQSIHLGLEHRSWLTVNQVHPLL